MSDLRLAGIDHIVLIVDDMEKALQFYSQELGATEIERLDSHGMVELSVGNAGLTLVDAQTEAGRWARPKIAGGRNLDHFCLRVAGISLDGLKAWASSCGHEVVEEGDASIYLLDPAGNQVELKVVDDDRRIS